MLLFKGEKNQGYLLLDDVCQNVIELKNLTRGSFENQSHCVKKKH